MFKNKKTEKTLVIENKTDKTYKNYNDYKDYRPYHFSVLGVKVDKLTRTEVLDRIENFLAQKDKVYRIATINPEFIVEAQKNSRFKEVLNKADLGIIDGAGVEWAIETSFERFTGVDLVEELCRLAGKHSWRVFFLGAKPGVADEALECQKRKYPGLIGEAGSGPGDIKKIFDKKKWEVGNGKSEEETESENEYWLKKIQDYRPQLLFVAFGAPWQDLWIDKYKKDLPFLVAMGVGGAFDYLSGQVKRAPKWMRNSGFEWLYRLIREPWRIKRQIIGGKFFLLVLREKLRS